MLFSILHTFWSVSALVPGLVLTGTVSAGITIVAIFHV